MDNLSESEYEEETWADFMVSAAIWVGIAGVVVALLFVKKQIAARQNAKNAKKARK